MGIVSLIAGMAEIEQEHKEVYVKEKGYAASYDSDFNETVYREIGDWLHSFTLMLKAVKTDKFYQKKFSTIEDKVSEVIYGLNYYYKENRFKNTIYKYYQDRECTKLYYKLSEGVKQKDVIKYYTDFETSIEALHKKIYRYKNKNLNIHTTAKLRTEMIEDILAKRQKEGKDIDYNRCLWVWSIEAKDVYNQVWCNLKLDELNKKYNCNYRYSKKRNNSSYGRFTNNFLIEELGLTKREQDYYKIYSKEPAGKKQAKVQVKKAVVKELYLYKSLSMDDLLKETEKVIESHKELNARERAGLEKRTGYYDEMFYDMVEGRLYMFKKFLEGINSHKSLVKEFSTSKEKVAEILYVMNVCFEEPSQKEVIYDVLFNDGGDSILFYEEIQEAIKEGTEEGLSSILKELKEEIDDLYNELFYFNEELERHWSALYRARIRFIESLLGSRKLRDYAPYLGLWKNEASELYSDGLYILNLGKILTTYEIKNIGLEKVEHRNRTNEYIKGKLRLSEKEVTLLKRFMAEELEKQEYQFM